MYVKKAEKLKMLHDMLLIRFFEEEAKVLLEAGEISGELHPYIGQEAVAVGICCALEKGDLITSTHRGHGHILAKGADVNKVMAELGARSTGYCKGKGGSMHVTDWEAGVLGVNGRGGQGVPIALGAAFANHYKRNECVAVAFFGEGASNEGVIHEALNMASIWKLPIIFVCENNQYSGRTKVTESTSIEDIADRANAYSMEGIVVDGMDVLTVYEAAKKAVRYTRSRKGPVLMECKTYRYGGHFSQEDECSSTPYRSKAEIDFYRKLDPIEQLKYVLVEERIPREVFVMIENRAKQMVHESIAFMRESPYPTFEQAYEDAYDLPVKGWL
ncbi:thiamine pyrophosphate-dependent dehydrogenase E1 component subunit alpha [Robertmurraya massiliosenegalensis]|uniref:thiamine pyrophosphate-dependent dehydrogenase E1 component subunit alpha n=1 Tax=Robertmurraya massiliosenegalensis TaxID=1287657 RepID=UPI0002D80303|nr:thiamine pyrophosphate-dependent dehydrogenase E1 component subunit alpha [Robertmurraya massiliosenegalensis]